MIRATLIKDLTNVTGRYKSLYRLSEPVVYEETKEVNEDGTRVVLSTDHVIVSAVDSCDYYVGLFPCRLFETYIFPTNSDGKVLSWSEMDGSERAVFDHKKVIENAGWVLDS